MYSRALRWSCVVLALIAIAAAASLVIRSEQQLNLQTASLRGFDQHAHDASAALVDARVGQQAYVAAGQGAAFWFVKTSAAIQAVRLDNFHVLTGTGSETSATQTYNIAIASITDNAAISSLTFGNTVTVNFTGNAGTFKERFLPTPVNISSWGPVFDGSMSVAIRVTRDGSDSSTIDSFFRSIGIRLATTG